MEGKEEKIVCVIWKPQKGIYMYPAGHGPFDRISQMVGDRIGKRWREDGGRGKRQEDNIHKNGWHGPSLKHSSEGVSPENDRKAVATTSRPEEKAFEQQ